ncbi:MAG: type II CRISPR RNA-guided endonuclease Cas9 [Opitutaceae bacterium]|nr:type II CRISPR RNA-guided endonuclease Cas9 [Cytophagales bacterium]
MMNILGLDLGTNSIGWALVEQNFEEKTGQIINAGSRIIPMSQDILGKFDSGVSISQTAERTGFRGVRRLRERHLLRRERLHRVLNILGYLPVHYATQIDFEKRFGQFVPEKEPKLPYVFNSETSKSEFLFKDSFDEMTNDFKLHQPQLFEEVKKNGETKKIPYDWTIYYLRKKALTKKIEKEELAWLLLNFNQKRGYYQLRGEDGEENPNKLVEFYALRVTKVEATEDKKTKDEIWYNVVLENGWIYRRTSKTPLDWVGIIKEFIVTTDLNDDGKIKLDKDGKEKRSFRAPAPEDWTLLKKKTEFDIGKSGKTVGTYIYDTLLKNLNQKIKGKLVTVIERKFYKAELETILKTQKEFHTELQDGKLYADCLEELYEYNEAHRTNIGKKDFTHLFLNDIIFYQRPLKSKKSLISDCKFESRTFVKEGKTETEPIKCIAKSHPLFQELRLWKLVQDLRIIQKEKLIDGKFYTDVNVTNEHFKTVDDHTALFEWLNNRKEIDQKAFLKYFKLSDIKFRWNYVEDKIYPCNETRSQILSRLAKIENVPHGFLNTVKEEALWHILYSVEDKNEIQRALKTFATKNGLGEDFVEQFAKFPPFKKEYGSYSVKAIKKLLPLMRMGKYWNENTIHPLTTKRIDKILSGEFDDKIRTRVREKAINLQDINDFQGLPEWLVSYIVYDRSSEDGNALVWKKPEDIDYYLRYIFKQHELRNPIVEQVITETLRVVKDIWTQHGNGTEKFFNEIHIELGREMKNPADKRRQMTEQINENENTNLRIKALLMEMMNDREFENTVRPYSPSQQEILKIYEEGALNASNDIPEDILKIAKQAQPSSSDLTKYKLWLQQKYKSPYTGRVIPLNKLFTSAYEIEHIIPQSRYFDDSFSNKVICEAAVNKDKDNSLAMEYILNEGGKVLEIGFGESVTILQKDDYEQFVKTHYYKSKMKKLLMEEIPQSFIERQLNDTRYISKVVKNLMSNIVREEGEQETISKNVIASNGSITSTLKQDWGLNDIWNDIITPRFERLNHLTNTTNFGSVNPNTNKFLPQVPIELQKGFSKKRIDHRHHALDAIVIACATRSHINYLNNESALGKGKEEVKEKKRYDLRHKLCTKKYNDASKQHYKWAFNKPWDTFTQDTRGSLYSIVVSFKQNIRVINKTVNLYQKWKENGDGKMVKELVKQTKGDSWAVRKPMHKDTVSGSVKLRNKKTVNLSLAIDEWESIADNPELRKQIKELVGLKYDKKLLLKYFKDRGNKWDGKDISKVNIFYWETDNVASRVKLDESFSSSKIESITDSGIKKILSRHLEKYHEHKNDKVTEHPELAFGPDGIDELNKNIAQLNGGKPHQPIHKVRTYEPKGNKFAVGETGNKKDKYVEAAKGTNLFFAIYQDEKGKSNYDTIPLNIVIERQKQGLFSVPEKNEAGDFLILYLSPNDLVYVPGNGENINTINFTNLNKEQKGRIYKFVSCTGNEGHFVPNNYSKEIVKNEMGTNNKSQNAIDGTQIKSVCTKLKTDRLGNVKPYFKAS